MRCRNNQKYVCDGTCADDLPRNVGTATVGKVPRPHLLLTQSVNKLSKHNAINVLQNSLLELDIATSFEICASIIEALMLGSKCFKLLSSKASQRSFSGVCALDLSGYSRCYHSTSLLRRAAGSRPVSSLYVDTIAPTSHQSSAAETFFQTHEPSISWVATEWRAQPHNDTAYLTPEVAFLGRSNSGKSSLLNGLLQRPSLCRVGPKPGKTTTMHAWALSPAPARAPNGKKIQKEAPEPKLTVLDMPGYGHGSHREWGGDIMKYLTTRRQLRRAFLLINPAHGLKKRDLQMLELLRGHSIPHQLIATKCDHDAVRNLPMMLAEIQAKVRAHFSSGEGKESPLLMTIGDILAVGALGDGKMNNRVNREAMRGLDDVRWAVLKAAGLEDYALALLTDKKTSLRPAHLPSAQLDAQLSPQEPGAQSLLMPRANKPSQPLEMSTDPQPHAPASPEIGLSIADLMGDSSDHTSPGRDSPPKTGPSIDDLMRKVSSQNSRRSEPQPSSARAVNFDGLTSTTSPATKSSLPGHEMSSSPKVGVGIDALMSMTGATPKKASAGRDRTSGGRTRPALRGSGRAGHKLEGGRQRRSR